MPCCVSPRATESTRTEVSFSCSQVYQSIFSYVVCLPLGRWQALVLLLKPGLSPSFRALVSVRLPFDVRPQSLISTDFPSRHSSPVDPSAFFPSGTIRSSIGGAHLAPPQLSEPAAASGASSGSAANAAVLGTLPLYCSLGMVSPETFSPHSPSWSPGWPLLLLL